MKRTILLLIVLLLSELTSAEKCVYDLVLEDRSVIESGQVFRSPDNSKLFLEQRRDGNLVVREGSTTLWESRASGPIGDYFTRLQGGGNMITYKGPVGDSCTIIWKSKSSHGGSTSYFVGLDCDQQHVCIFEGTHDNTGDCIWRKQTTSETTPPTPTSTSTTHPVKLAFYVMGDVPYTPSEEKVLKSQLKDMTLNLHPKAAFLAHVGDMQRACRTKCSKSHFEGIRDIFLQKSPLPTFVLAGDNDYLDCPDEENAWDIYLDTFFKFEQKFEDRLPSGAPKLAVERWDEQRGGVKRKEMFAFVEQDILFLSVTLMNMNLTENEPPDDLFYERLSASKTWVKRHLKKHDNDDIRGVVMFGHAMITKDLEPFFREQLKGLFHDEGFGGVPVLYIHGDGHKFVIDRGLGRRMGWEQFTSCQVDQGGRADPLLIEVAPVVDGKTKPPKTNSSGKQFIVGNGLFRVDRQQGLYLKPKAT